MKFLDTDNVCIKQRRAKLLLDLYELIHQTSSGSATMSQWCLARGHQNKAAALRDLYRYKAVLEPYGVVLDFGTEEAFAVDLKAKGLRALVAREIDEATLWLAARGHRNAVEKLVKASVEAFTRCSKGVDGFEEARAIHEATFRAALSRHIDTQVSEPEGDDEMLSSCNLTPTPPRVRVSWTKKTGPRPVEAAHPSEDVEKAARLARSKSPYKVKLLEISRMLDCSASTAARFIQRVRGGRMSSDSKPVKR